MSPILLSRDAFREAVFERDDGICVLCDKPAQDAHHILERRLWSDGGYYLDNGASVCAEHHLECEMTTISVEDIRHACSITHNVVPEQLYPDHSYDKWGNHILANGQRTKGPLFHDESVQKILAKGRVLDLFTDYVKYPRTFHLPWSECVHSDDKVSKWEHLFNGRRVIVTEKLDGENTSLYNGYYHARSINSKHHESRSWAKTFHAQFQYDIPEGWRICAENMYMEHSIHYDDLKSYLYGFSIWDDKNQCLSWDDTLEWLSLFGIEPVPVLYDGVYDRSIIESLYSASKWGEMEGYVVRIADMFDYGEFHKNVSKFVRKDHIQTVKHCMLSHNLVKNELMSD